MKEKLYDDFMRVFREMGEASYFSPGRVNLIGEHTDYNGGMVFPCAITLGTYAVISKRKDMQFHLYSNNFPDKGSITVDLENLHYDAKDDWANYVKGVLFCLRQEGYAVSHGLNILVEGNIPNGSGLSSSASLEVLIATIANEVFQFGIDKVKLALLCQKAENEFVGVNCGIMDQFIIAMGKKDYAVALDTGKMKYEYAPVALNEYRIVIMNTNKKRELADSKYNERRSECETALQELQKVIAVENICDLDLEQLKEYKTLIPSETIYRRVRHAVSENARVKDALTALNQKDVKKFGLMMNASHISLRDDYEVTGKELDALISSAWKQNGVIGARMTGAGFGGCAIALVKQENLEQFKRNVRKEYEQEIGYSCDFYIASIGDGARKLDDACEKK